MPEYQISSGYGRQNNYPVFADTAMDAAVHEFRRLAPYTAASVVPVEIDAAVLNICKRHNGPVPRIAIITQTEGPECSQYETKYYTTGSAIAAVACWLSGMLDATLSKLSGHEKQRNMETRGKHNTMVIDEGFSAKVLEDVNYLKHRLLAVEDIIEQEWPAYAQRIAAAKRRPGDKLGGEVGGRPAKDNPAPGDEAERVQRQWHYARYCPPPEKRVETSGYVNPVRRFSLSAEIRDAALQMGFENRDNIRALGRRVAALEDNQGAQEK